MMTALFAVSQDDADRYKGIYRHDWDLANAKVFLVDAPSRMEGYRCNAAYATPEARDHAGYWKAWYTMRNNYVLCNRTAPRVL